MKNFIVISFGIVLLAFIGCVSYQPGFVKTAMVSFPPKQSDCEFAVITTVPQKKFEEIGVVENQSYVISIADFKKMCQPFVCANGGDAVVALVNGNGIYIKGTIIKFK
ncbi:hypothetical protein AB3N59_08620 [Leptospira sp. WS92.C1]